ncbi:MAG: hypothetical protein IPG93_24725 [Burkholderiales bacterium]|nr:hypothetical protein [Burkholderiales bacterium]
MNTNHHGPTRSNSDNKSGEPGESASKARRVGADVSGAVTAGVDLLLGRPAFAAALGVGFTKFHELAKSDPRFPEAIALSKRCVRYRASAVKAYIEALGGALATDPQIDLLSGAAPASVRGCELAGDAERA